MLEITNRRLATASAIMMATSLIHAWSDSPTNQRRPHPDALPNQHKSGDVDNPDLVPFVVQRTSDLAGIVIDEMDAELIGTWMYSTHTPPYVGLGYLHDQKKAKGENSVTYRPLIPHTGFYEVRLSHCYNVRRATNTPVTIHHADGEKTLRINQQKIPEHKRLFRTLGKFKFLKGKNGWVRITTEGTTGKYVIADSVQFIPMPDKHPEPGCGYSPGTVARGQ